jgi:hypothetical protein
MSKSKLYGLIVAIGFSIFGVLGVVFLLILSADRTRNLAAKSFAERAERKRRAAEVLASEAAATKRTASRPSADVRVAAWQLYRDYLRQPRLAENEYLRKTLEVTGSVKSIVLGEKDRVTLFLNVEDAVDGRPHEAGLRCDFPREALDKVAQFRVGDQVMVRGSCAGLTNAETVLLRDCSECEPAK